MLTSHLPSWVLAAVFLLIVFRRLGSIPVQIWQAMLLGAVVVVLFGAIRPAAAWAAIDWDVLLFLFGAFILGEALVVSGALYSALSRVLRPAANGAVLLAIWVGVVAIGSAVLMNDTIAIVATPLAIRLAREAGLAAKPLLFALMFAVTIGSVTSPIGNPQNLLIALHGDLAAPFYTFLRSLFWPTLLNVVVLISLLLMTVGRQWRSHLVRTTPSPTEDSRLAVLAWIGVGVLLACIGWNLASAALAWSLRIPLSAMALAAAAPVVVLSPQRWRLVRGIDWTTLVFFAAMFVLMASVWQSQTLQTVMHSAGVRMEGAGQILAVSVVLSQLISNVPLVALFLPAVAGLHDPGLLMAMAAGSTVAGNLTILGAASNVIVIQRAERYGVSISFWEFFKIGLPITMLNSLIYLFALV